MFGCTSPVSDRESVLNVRQSLDPTAKGQASRLSLSLPEILYASLYGGITQNGALGLQVGGISQRSSRTLQDTKGKSWLVGCSPPHPQQIVKLSCERLNSAMPHRAACTGLHPCNETYRAGLDFNLLLALGGFWKNHLLGVRITPGIAEASNQPMVISVQPSPGVRVLSHLHFMRQSMVF